VIALPRRARRTGSDAWGNTLAGLAAGHRSAHALGDVFRPGAAVRLAIERERPVCASGPLDCPGRAVKDSQTGA